MLSPERYPTSISSEKEEKAEKRKFMTDMESSKNMSIKPLKIQPMVSSNAKTACGKICSYPPQARALYPHRLVNVKALPLGKVLNE